MLEYLLNLIPRLRQYSSDLNKEQLFVDKTFTLLQEDHSIHNYIFRRGGTLVLTIDGIGKNGLGSWELLPTGQLLINRGGSEIILLEFDFLHPDVIIMKYSGTINTPFIIYNQQAIPDGDVLGYLERFEAIRNGQKVHKVNDVKITESENEGDKRYNNEDGTLFSGDIFSQPYSYRNPFNQNDIEVTDIFHIDNGIKTEETYICKIKIDGLGYIAIRQSDKDFIKVGDQFLIELSNSNALLNYNSPLSIVSFSQKIFYNDSYTITKVENDFSTELFLIIFITVLITVVGLIFVFTQ
jgi:hypothetical protein